MLVVEISYADPAIVYNAFSSEIWAFLLDSADSGKQFDDTNRYSYIAVDPLDKIFIKNEKCLMSGETVKNPFKYLKKILDKFKRDPLPGLPPFQGGAVGYFSYDLCHYLENINKPTQIEKSKYADLAVGIYDIVIAFDHVLKKAWIISAGISKENEELKIARVLDRLSEQKEISLINNADVDKINLASRFSKEEYMELVKKAQNYILEGDIFEVNISHRFQADIPSKFEDNFSFYLKMRKANPSPFSAYLNLGDHQILSASPERFLLLDTNRTVSARPIKGTAARGISPEEDAQIAVALSESEKDRSENIMITDLLRNDLSKVCTPESVIVKKLCGVETFPTVHHLVTVVAGELKEEFTALDLLEACYPGGSITGAPKVRAMQIIYELEPTARGPYCGSIGYVGFNGTMDTSIVIRTVLICDNMISYQAGGAVVLDSSPENEYEETLIKSLSIRKVLSLET